MSQEKSISRKKLTPGIKFKEAAPEHPGYVLLWAYVAPKVLDDSNEQMTQRCKSLPHEAAVTKGRKQSLTVRLARPK